MFPGALLIAVLATLLSLALSLIFNRVMIYAAPRLGLMDQPGERRIHVQAIPRAGGLAVWLSFMLVLAAGLATGQFADSGNLSWQWLGAFATGSGVLIVAGIVDDRRGMPPLLKLGFHFLAPILFFLIHPMNSGFFPAHWPEYADLVLFVVWCVVLVNAFNLIDGLDGLCGGLATMATGALGLLSLLNGRSDAAVLLFLMSGAMIGFLKYNLNPARIFLGDAGSMMIGFFIAAAATDAVGRRAVLGSILLPIAVAGVPLLDVLLAIWRRGARRLILKMRGEEIVGGIFSADSDHLHHRLLRSGGSQKKVAVTLHLISIGLAVFAFLPLVLGDRLIGVSIVGLMVIGLLGIRHLMRVEMENTGSVIHLAIKLPSARRRIATALFFYDLLVLAAAGVVALLIETNMLVRADEIRGLFKMVILFMILGSICLLASQVHRRLWVRATFRDLLSIQFWLMAAALASFTLFSLMQSSMEWSGLRLALLAYIFSCAGVCLPRVFLEVARELALEARHGSSKNLPSSDDCDPVIVLGAGDLGALFLEHLKSSPHDYYPRLRLLGFLDEAIGMRGRKLRSFRILGGLDKIQELVVKNNLKGIVLAISNPRQELLDQINQLANEYNLRIYRWNVGLEETGVKTESCDTDAKNILEAV